MGSLRARAFVLASCAWGGCYRPDLTQTGGEDGGAGTDGGGGIDASDSDARVDAAPCVGAGVVFCDGFEDPPETRWDEVCQMAGTAVRDTTRHHGGASSLRVDIQASGQAAVVVNPFTLADGELHMRAWFYVPSGPALEHLDVMNAFNPTSDSLSALVFQEALGVWSQPAGDGADGTTSMPRDVWACLELKVDLDDVIGSMELSLGGVVMASFIAADTLPDNGITDVAFGIPHSEGSQPAISIWVDDVAVGTQPIGCTN